jgi:NTE family protein
MKADPTKSPRAPSAAPNGQHADATSRDPREYGQIVLVLQGGGALGAYQAGVFQALHEAGIEPDWVIGTSIGAINAALIAGNKPENRVIRLREFWRRMDRGVMSDFMSQMPFFGAAAANFMTMAQGLRGFFAPNPLAFMGMNVPLGAEQAAFYSTTELERNLSELVDFDIVGKVAPRLTVGAANVRTGEMRYFDSRDETLSIKHVMASGALPPAFPAVRIGEDLFWDGGILSNTPVEAVFDDTNRKNSLIFAVHIWNPNGPEPTTLNQVFHRQKDLQYSSRAANHIRRQQQLHQLRHVVAQLGRAIPEAERTPEIREMIKHGCLIRMHVVRLLAPTIDGENHAKDIDFSSGGIRARWDAGYAETTRVLAEAPWQAAYGDEHGFVLHEASGGVMATTGHADLGLQQETR